MNKIVRAKVAERLLAHKKETMEDNPAITDWFLIAVNGSHNYDLDTPTSDVDTKFLAIPSLDQLLYKSPTNYLHVMRDNGEHTEVKDIRSYVHTMLKQNINFVETLYAQVVYVNPKYKQYWDMMVDMRDAISSCNPIAAVKCMQGMAHQKRKDMVTETPGRAESIQLFGYDKKSFHHIRIFVRKNNKSFPSRFHNGSRFRDSVPLWHGFLRRVLSAGLLCGITPPSRFHNGSKFRDSVPLRNRIPLGPCHRLSHHTPYPPSTFFHLPKVCRIPVFSSHLPKVRGGVIASRAPCVRISPATVVFPPSEGAQFSRVFVSPSEGVQFQNEKARCALS